MTDQGEERGESPTRPPPPTWGRVSARWGPPPLSAQHIENHILLEDRDNLRPVQALNESHVTFYMLSRLGESIKDQSRIRIRTALPSPYPTYRLPPWLSH